MSLAVSEHFPFTEQVQHYDIGNGIQLYTHIVTGPNEGKTLLFIHGGGSGGNHTMLLRPAKWLIEQGMFAKVILPDRRGEGLSTPLTQPLSLKDHAQDMQALLNTLAIDGNISTAGISYGGPIALELAALDNRVAEVILMASSPSLRGAQGVQGFLYRRGWLDKIVRNFYKKNLGKLPAAYPDFEPVYDLKSNRELTQFFTRAIQQTDRRMMESLMFQNASTLDPANSAVSSDLKLDIPLFQVIGSKDEIWETDLRAYKDQFPNITSFLVEGEDHKGVILRAEVFYEGLQQIYV